MVKISDLVNVLSTQSGPEDGWQEGRVRDMEAFDALPKGVRDWLNDNVSDYPVEDILWEHENVHASDEATTMAWLLETQIIFREMPLAA